MALPPSLQRKIAGLSEHDAVSTVSSSSSHLRRERHNKKKDDEQRLRILLKFFGVWEHFEILKTYRDAKDKRSATLLDWFVVDYVKTHNVTYKLSLDASGGTSFMEHINAQQCYEAARGEFKKERFDPYARGKRITLQFKDPVTSEVHQVETSLRQLNFFRWAIVRGIIGYVENHLDTIYADMIRKKQQRRQLRAKAKAKAKKQSASDDGKKKRDKKKKRSQLSSPLQQQQQPQQQERRHGQKSRKEKGQ